MNDSILSITNQNGAHPSDIKKRIIKALYAGLFLMMKTSYFSFLATSAVRRASSLMEIFFRPLT